MDYKPIIIIGCKDNKENTLFWRCVIHELMLNDPIFRIEAYRGIKLNRTRRHYLPQLFVDGFVDYFHRGTIIYFFKHNSGQWNVEVQPDTNFPNETCI